MVGVNLKVADYWGNVGSPSRIEATAGTQFMPMWDCGG